MKSIFLSIAAIAMLCTSTNAWAQVKLVKKVTRTGNELVIPFEEYKLQNGLTLIVHEDHSDPIVHVDVTYHVGSAREEIGKSGFAHFFEHMMFQGSDNVGDEQHFKIISEAGGTLNGTTNQDRTNYFETVPSNQLEKMLWLEADRMGFLVNAVTQKKFEVQRSTVKNERGQNYDNRPYGLVGETANRNLYPYGHPYSWLTIGYVEDLNRVNVEDLKNFFLRWYGPNNAVVTVGGDVATKDVVKLVEQYFGSIPAGPEVKPVQVPAVNLTTDRYVSMTDQYAKLPMLDIVYPTVPNYHPDEAPLDCLADILGGGNNSIFYKNFVKTQQAVNASVFHPCTELSGEMNIRIVPFPGKKLSDMDKLVDESLAEFEKRGVSEADVTKFKNDMESQMIYSLASVSGKVSQLASNYTFTGDANYIGKNLKRYQEITKEDVMRVYNKYIKGKHALHLSVLTKGNETNKAADDNYVVNTAGYTPPDYGYAGLKYNKATDKFDRSKMPGNGENPVVKVPAFWKKELPGNVHVIGTKDAEIPVVTMVLTFKGGRMMDAYTPNKAGTANLFANMMEEDTKNYSAEDFTTALQNLGSSISFNPSRDGIQVQVQTLSKNLKPTMALLEERLLRPNFTEEAFDNNKQRTLEGIKNANQQPSYVANNAFSKMIYGKDNVLSWPTLGTEKTVKNIELEDMNNYYKKYISRNDAKVVVVGDADQAEIEKSLAFLQKLPANEVTLPTLPALPKSNKTKVYILDIPNAAQSEFRVGYATNMKYDALGDYYKSNVMNFPLGGAFNSRLNLDLREDKGWTYGARSGFNSDKYSGIYQFSAGIRSDATDSAMLDIVNIMSDFRDKGMTSEELAFTQKSIGQSEARKYESGYDKAGFLSRILEYNLPSDYSKKQNDMLSKMKTDDVNKLAAKNIPDVKNMTIVLAADKAKVKDKLVAQGYEVVELDREGNIISDKETIYKPYDNR